MKTLYLSLTLLSLTGCSTPSEEPLDPSGSDKLPISACAKCDDKKIFYKNGNWTSEDRRQMTEDRP